MTTPVDSGAGAGPPGGEAGVRRQATDCGQMPAPAGPPPAARTGGTRRTGRRPLPSRQDPDSGTTVFGVTPPRRSLRGDTHRAPPDGTAGPGTSRHRTAPDACSRAR